MGADQYAQLVIPMSLQAAGTGEVLYGVWKYPGRWLITACGIIGDAVAADASNVTQITLANTTQSQTLLDHDTTTGQEGALTAATFTSSGFSAVTGEGLVIDSGDVFTLTKADGGTGKAWAGSAVILARRIQG